MLKTVIVFFILSCVGVFFQSSFLPQILPFSAVPDFILILVIWIALSYEERAGLLGAFFLGILADFASGVYLGPQAAGSVLACVLVQGFSRHVYADRFLSIGMVTLIASLVKQLSSQILILSFTGFKSVPASGLYILTAQAILTALCAPLIIRLVFAPKRKKIL